MVEVNHPSGCLFDTADFSGNFCAGAHMGIKGVEKVDLEANSSAGSTGSEVILNAAGCTSILSRFRSLMGLSDSDSW